MIEIIIDLTDEPNYTYDHVTQRPNQSFRRSWVSGMRDLFLSIGAEPDSSMFVIRFRPGKAYPFLQLPMDHLYNRVIDGDCLYGRPIDVLREQLLHAPDPAEKFRFGGVSFICCLVMSVNLAMFLNDAATDMAWGATAGFLAGFGWVAMAIIVIALFECRSGAYMFVNAGYMIVAFVVMGLIIGAWR